jgi:diaminohydroxyphosphoribosylaminopyrimidine deaminase / 5-amino-6-(5-phosphoribosylamino)uracil reductase
MIAAVDARHMRRAIALARTRLGATAPNPVVGCLIARSETLLAEAATAPGGRPHAEEQALALAGSSAHGATAYVTLEPCGERSSGEASCAERLIAAGISRVVYACENPDHRSAGRGPVLLRAAGLTVERGLLEDEAASLYG